MLKLIYSSSIASIATIIFITVITIWAENDPGLKDGLKSLSGHHWVTKSLLVVIVYSLIFLLSNLFNKLPSPEMVRKSVYYLIGVSVLAVIAILGFFIWHNPDTLLI